jgi:glycosyltransferase involved in cell wall biosynthesis
MVRKERVEEHRLMASHQSPEKFDDENRRQVTLVAGTWPPMRCGIAPYSRNLAAHLRGCGYRVRVVADSQAAGTDDPDMIFVRRWSVAAMWRLAVGLRRSPPQIVHLQHPTRATRQAPGVYVLPLFVRLLLPRHRMVTTFHYIRPVDVRTALLRLFFLVPALASHAVVVTTAWEAAYVRTLLPWKRLIVAPAGITFEITRSSEATRRETRAGLGVADDDFVVAYFGFLVPNKGLETLLQAVAQLATMKLLVIGGEYDADPGRGRAYVEELKQQARSLGLHDRVLWAGAVSEQRSGEMLSASDCAALPFDEGASLKRSTLFAALQACLPVVTTNGPELDPAMSGGKNILLVEPRHAASLAAAIEGLRTDPDLGHRIAHGGRELLDLVSWTRIAACHDALYRELMRRRP